jgi:hypothetical protein
LSAEINDARVELGLEAEQTFRPSTSSAAEIMRAQSRAMNKTGPRRGRTKRA